MKGFEDANPNRQPLFKPPSTLIPNPLKPLLKPSKTLKNHILHPPSLSQIMAMEFWGVEVKAGEPLKVQAEEGMILHLSQAALGEVKKDKSESVLVSVTVDDKKMVLGTLSASSCPQIAYDLVFEKDFELSHNWKNGSVYFIGYRAEIQEESEDERPFESDSEESEEEEVPVVAAENGKAELKEKAKAPAESAKVDKPESAAAKKGKDAKPEEDSDDSDDSSEGDDSDEDMLQVGEDSDDSDEDDSSEEEEDTPTPKNVKQGKKRTADTATKTPVPEKKAKLVTPQKSGGDGKKGANTHTATPHPKKGAKTAEKSASKPSPKSAGNVTCKACSKSFNSDGALQSHTKAKHSDAK